MAVGRLDGTLDGGVVATRHDEVGLIHFLILEIDERG
jgi:hypothetical protein